MANLKDVKTVFTVEGQDRVIASFKSIAQAAIDANKKQLAAIKQGAKAQVNEAKSTEAKITAEVKKAGKTREDLKEKEYKALLSETKKWASQELAETKKANKAIEQEAKRSAAAREAIAKRAASVIGNAASKAISPVITGSKIAGAAVAALGVDAVRRGVTNRATAKGISIQSGYYEEQAKGIDPSNGKGVSTEATTAMAKSVAKKYGISEAEVLAGMQSTIAKAGDGKFGVDFAKNLAELQVISGADMGDLGSFAGAIRAKDEKLTSDQVLDLMTRAMKQGELGQVELKDLASYGTRLVSQAGQFEGGIAKNLPKTMMLAQLATDTGEATDAAEATTAVARVSSRIASKEADLNALGIKTRNKDTNQWLDEDEILAQSISKTHGDGSKLNDIWGERVGKLTTGLSAIYNQTVASSLKSGMSKKDAWNAGEQAVAKRRAEMRDVNLTPEERNARVKAAMEEDEKKIATSMQELYEIMDKELTPVLKELIPVLKEVIPLIKSGMEQLVPYLKSAIEHPFLALIAYMSASFGASIAGELAKAGLAKIVETGIAKALAEAAVARGVQTAAVAAGASGTGTTASVAQGVGSKLFGRLALPLFLATMFDGKSGQLNETDDIANTIAGTDESIMKSSDPEEKKKWAAQRRAYLQGLLNNESIPEENGTEGDKDSIRKVLDKFNEDGSLNANFVAVEKSAERLAKANNEAAAAAERLALAPPPPTTAPPTNGKGQ